MLENVEIPRLEFVENWKFVDIIISDGGSTELIVTKTYVNKPYVWNTVFSLALLSTVWYFYHLYSADTLYTT